jgi:hypothetical protein
MRTGRLLVAALLAAACGSSPPPPPAAPPAAAPPPTAPAAPAGDVADEGTLRLSIGGAAMGTERFVVRREADGWRLRSSITIEQGGVAIAAESELRADADWRVVSAHLRGTANGQPVEVTVARGAGGLLESRVVAAGNAQVQHATRAVDWFVGDNTMSHLYPVCTLADEAAER